MKFRLHADPLTSADRLLTEQQVASILSWSKKTLQQRRWRGLPPAFCKIGGSVRYLERDILAFIDAGRSTRVSNGGANA